MLRAVFLCAALALVGATEAGAVGIRVQWDGTPFPELKYRPSEIDADETKYRFESFGWMLQSGLSVSGSDQLTLRFGYSRRRVTREVLGDRATRLPTWNLYNLSGAIGWAHRWHDGVETELALAPRYENGSEGTSKSIDYKLAASALARRVVPNMAVGIGVAWGWDFGKKRIWPLVEIRTPPIESAYSIDFLIPVRGEVGYRVHDVLSLSLLAIQSGGEYRVEDPDGRRDEWVRYSSVSIGPSARVSLPGRFEVVFRGGRELRRNVDHRDNSGQWRRDVPDPAWIGQLTLQYGETVEARTLIPSGVR